MFKELDFNNFINIELPCINIRPNLKERLCNTSSSAESTLVIDTEEKIGMLLQLARDQYQKRDNKWILTYARYTHEIGHKLLDTNQPSNAIDYFSDSTTLSLLELAKALKRNMLSQLKEINLCLEDRAMDYMSSKICIIFERNKRIIHMAEVKSFLKSDLHNLTFLSSKKMEEKINCAYLVALRKFTSMLSVNEIISTADEFTALNNPNLLYYLRNVIRDKFRETRKLFFKEWMPSFNLEKRKEVDDLIKLIECSVKINNLLGEQKDSLLDESELYKFKAYLTTDSKTASECFDRSIEKLKIIRKTFPDITEAMKREIIFTVARKFEYLAALENNKDKRIGFLKQAVYHYGNLRSPMYYYLNFITLYFMLSDIISLESSPDKISDFCKEIMRKFPTAEKFWKLPFLKTLHKIVEVLTFWRSDPSDSTIFELMQRANIILDPSDFTKSVYRLTLSFCLVSNMFKEQAGVLIKYFTYILKHLVEEQKIDIAALTNHIHYIEDADSKEILQHIIQEEGQDLEFKGSFRCDVKRYLETSTKEMTEREEDSFLKTVVGFLNSRGGKIIIGLLEKSRFEEYSEHLKHLGHKLILGINVEYTKYGYDNYIRNINDKIRQKIDANVVSLLRIRKHVIDGIDILEINVPGMIAEGKRYYLNGKFYVREGNETVIKEGEELINYLQNIQKLFITGKP